MTFYLLLYAFPSVQTETELKNLFEGNISVICHISLGYIYAPLVQTCEPFHMPLFQYLWLTPFVLLKDGFAFTEPFYVL